MGVACGFWHGHVSAILYTPNLYLMPGAIFASACSKLHIVDVVCEVRWNLSSLIHCTDTFETISGVHLIEVSWFQNQANMQIQHFLKCPEYGGVLCFFFGRTTGN